MAPKAKKSKLSFASVKQKLSELDSQALLLILENIFNKGGEDLVMRSLTNYLEKSPQIYKIKYKLSGSIVEYDEEVYTDCHGEEQDAAEAEYDEKLDEFFSEFTGEAKESFLDIDSANKHARSLTKKLVKLIQASSSLFPMDDENTDTIEQESKTKDGRLSLKTSFENFAFDGVDGSLMNEVELEFKKKIIQLALYTT